MSAVMLDAATAVLATQRVIGVALVLQSVELLALRSVMADDGVFSWGLLRRELDGVPGPLLWLLDRLLGYRGVCALLASRALAALALLLGGSHPLLLLALWGSSVLLVLRFRGSFNGGSDFMTLVVLTALVVLSAFSGSAWVRNFALLYIAVHACHSYFLAGLAKLRATSWRQGSALGGFLRSSIYAPPDAAALAQPKAMSRLAGYGVIAFECAFPLALFGPRVCLAFIGAALLFHLVNAYVFGLNRFVFAWAATYPALLYCSQLFS